jgi:hypothetical protein
MGEIFAAENSAERVAADALHSWRKAATQR